MEVDHIKFAKNRAYQFVEDLQRALDEGRISEDEWFETNKRFFTDHYIAANNPRAQSGHSGDEANYRYTRMMVLEAIHKDGDFIDIGCANGYLMESLSRWLLGSGLQVEFYGLDFSERLLELAVDRSPGWRERFFHGNALYWDPPRRFDYVYIAGLEYVPVGCQEQLLKQLYSNVVSPGGRLILGPVTEERDSHALEKQLRSWGFNPAGFCEKSHQRLPQLSRKLFWFGGSNPDRDS